MAKKWFPGHYGYATDNETHTGIKDIGGRSVFKDNPYFTGYHCQYWWYKLEPSKGVYDFSLIERDLETCERDGKKMSIKFYDRFFHMGVFNSSPVNNRQYPGPKYLVTDEEYDGGFYPFLKQKILPKMWVMPLVQRQVLLLQALAAALDDHPALAAIVLEETALSDPNAIAGYTFQKHHDALVALNNGACAAFSKTPVFHLMNFGLNAELRDSLIRNAVVNNKCGMGSPDIYNTKGGILTQAFGPYYTEFDGIAHKYASVESSSTQVANADATFVLNFAVDDAKLNFMGWTPKTWGTGWMISDGIAAVNAQEGRIVTTKPTNISDFDGEEEPPPPPPPPILRGPYQDVTRQIPGTIPAVAWDVMTQGGAEISGEGVTYSDTSAFVAWGSPPRSITGTSNYPQTASNDGSRARQQKIGEWREYTVSIEATGTYKPFVTVCAPTAPPSPAVRFYIGGTIVSEFGIDSTGDWTYANRETFYGSPVTLTESTSTVLRFEVLSEGWDVFEFGFVTSADTPVDPPDPPDPSIPTTNRNKYKGHLNSVIILD